ncbi:MAG: DUF2442 domain-containing protein [Bacteroidetes bacterium]|nr:DUF2442 domain-containing protein [Patescibacteria group bacterium]MCL5030834.1 DUF2442 domain-containing protein [Bacteroidota bacterium]
MYYDAKSVKYIRDYLLEVVFVDGTKGVADLSEYSKRGGVFPLFADIEFFKRVFVNPPSPDEAGLRRTRRLGIMDQRK